MKVWLICDDYYHPGEVVIEGLAGLSASGIELTVTKDATEFSAERMKDYPVILFSKSNNVSATNRNKWLTPDIQKRFVEYVEAGGGLLVTHSGTASYQEENDFSALIGCKFLQHPEQCPVTMTMLKKHPVTDGVKSFTEIDEHYFVEVMAEDADIFMAATSANGTQVGGYTRRQGEGRVCVLTPGHNVEVWRNPENQELIKNAIMWCAALSVPERSPDALKG